MDNIKTKSVTKLNDLIEASYRLSLNEARIVFYGISLINPISKEFPLDFKIEIKRFAEMFNLESHSVYTILKQAAMDRFWEREFTIQTQEKNQLRLRWLTGIEYGDNEGYLKIFMNPQLKPLLHQLIDGSFTRYYLENISSFKSIYSIRFYEIAIMQLKRSKKSKWTFNLEIEEIKKRFALENKYKRFSNLKSFVLEPARKEINKHSDIRFNYDVIKKGRKPFEVKFIVSKKESEIEKIPHKELSTIIFEKAKQIAIEAGTGWDIYEIEKQFYAYANKKGFPENIDSAFIGFVKKKIKTIP